MSFRTIAASAGMLAALTLAATSTAPAAPAGSKPSASTQTRAAKAPHRAGKPQREAKARHGKRTRVARQRHRHSTERTAQARRPATSPRAEIPIAVGTAAARRFRDFLTPQSFADVSNEQLRSPRLVAAHFSGEIVDPELVLTDMPTPAAAEPRAEAPSGVAREQTTGDDSPSKTPPLAQGDAQVQRAAQTDKEPDRMSFVRWFFVAWGGVLALASAVRLAIG